MTKSLLRSEEPIALCANRADASAATEPTQAMEDVKTHKQELGLKGVSG